MAGTLYVVATPIGNLEGYDVPSRRGFWVTVDVHRL